MRMTPLKTIIVASAIALTVGACSIHKKAPSPVAATPASIAVAAPKVSLDSLDARLRIVEARNSRIDALVARRHALERAPRQ